MGTIIYEKEIMQVSLSAGLTQEDVDLWLALLSQSGELAEMMFLKIFSEDRELLSDITKNIRFKLGMGQGDGLSLKEIVEQDSTLLLKGVNLETV